MHSGIGPLNAVRIARGKGLQTVETTMRLAVIHEPELYKDTLVKYCVPKDQFCAISDNPSEDWVEVWAQISRAWAQYAEDHTTLATHKGGPRATSFYKSIEEPILQEKCVRIDVENQYKPGS
jgi:hypothetical protein